MRLSFLETVFKVFQETHGDYCPNILNIIIIICVETEKTATSLRIK